VFNRGKVEQVGAPSELYEQPQTPFVAGFVGVSNLVTGEMALRITGSPEMFSVRPEKIHLADRSTPIPPDMYCADGAIRDVTYLGLYTRYLVDLEGDCERCSLVVIDQNRDTTSMEVVARRSQPVRLLWNKSHNRYVQERGAP
jgi:putative spermidine/putrescine transport system ATP-binding protein